MTIALDYPAERQSEIINEYFSRFGRAPIPLTARRLSVCAQHGGVWNQCTSVDLGQHRGC